MKTIIYKQFIYSLLFLIGFYCLLLVMTGMNLKL